MTEKNARLHVTFNDSASGSLRLALAEAGRNDHVITCLDDFSFGPINPDDPETRARWMETELSICGERFRGRSDEVVTLALSTADPPIAWISRESAGTMAAFMWWLSHMESKEVLLLQAPNFSTLMPASIREFFGREARLSDEDRSIYLARWTKLKSENSPFRVLTNTFDLVSAPIDYFDGSLLKHVTSDWRKMAYIVASALAYQWETGLHQSGDIVLAARLRALAEMKVIEGRGELGDIRHGEVRLKV